MCYTDNKDKEPITPPTAPGEVPGTGKRV